MSELLIKNGHVYDPLNGIFGDVMDIAVKDGVIVNPSELSSDAKVIDAEGGIVAPGGIDVHTHIAGPKVNTGRLLSPGDHIGTCIPASGGLRSQTGRSVPNVFKIGYGYARMGYTTVAEAASPPLETRHTHEEMDDIPIVDKLTYIIADSNWLLLDYLSEGRHDLVEAYVAWLLRITKGYGIKIVNPGADWAWLHGVMGIDVDSELPEYGITPRDILLGLGEAVESLRLPHPIHVHCNKLGYPGNYESTLKTMGLANKYSRGLDRPAMHITHVQFTGYKGDSWITLGSGGEDIAKEVERTDSSVDLGQLIFGPTLTMTADAPFEFVLYHLERGKWSFADVEAETSAGIVPYVYKKRNYVNTIQWCIGLEVALLVRDPWKVYITTDHPNA
ncbi:MAG: formylmethanofuran dehydrogenase subunit A, partial [Candidatus Korarchaeota archaeon]|nr:formylmethanofuran dehydrogenase subunit A [Candidatus Korarchaeota archaeon]